MYNVINNVHFQQKRTDKLYCVLGAIQLSVEFVDFFKYFFKGEESTLLKKRKTSLKLVVDTNARISTNSLVGGR